MATPLVINGVTYSFPQTGDQGWGDSVTNWATAVTQGMLQKAGGSFALTADVDFGSSFGLKAPYYKSSTSNIASAGQIRLANADTIKFRNAANGADLPFGAGSSDAIPSWNSVDLANISTSQTLTNKTIDAASNTIANIADANIKSAAAIALNKLAALGTAKALQSNSSTGFIEASTVTNTELAFVSGVTSSIQTQLNAKQASGNYITALTGEVTASGPGSSAATLTNSAVIGKVLTGFSAAAGTVAATDTILQAFQKVVGNQFGGSATAKSADYTILDNDGILTVLMTTSTTNRTVTLPAAANNTNRLIYVKKVDSSTGLCTVARAGGSTIDGATSFILADQYDFVAVQCDGTNWSIVDKGIGNGTLSRVKDDSGAGHGSTNTKVRRIENNIINTGNAITRATSATNGNSYTIVQSGIYSIQYLDLASTGAATIGVSNNSAQLTTSIITITSANRLTVTDTPAANLASMCKVDLRLAAGDVIRPHTDGSPDSVAGRTVFDITKIGL